MRTDRLDEYGERMLDLVGGCFQYIGNKNCGGTACVLLARVARVSSLMRSRIEWCVACGHASKCARVRRRWLWWCAARAHDGSQLPGRTLFGSLVVWLCGLSFPLRSINNIVHAGLLGGCACETVGLSFSLLRNGVGISGTKQDTVSYGKTQQHATRQNKLRRDEIIMGPYVIRVETGSRRNVDNSFQLKLRASLSGEVVTTIKISRLNIVATLRRLALAALGTPNTSRLHLEARALQDDKILYEVLANDMCQDRSMCSSLLDDCVDFTACTWRWN